MKEYKGRQLKIRFSSPGTALKIRNLSTWVTNELLEKAFSVSVRVLGMVGVGHGARQGGSNPADMSIHPL